MVSDVTLPNRAWYRMHMYLGCSVRRSMPLFALLLAVIAGTTVLAQQASQAADFRQRDQSAERFVNERLAVWQQQLNLADWKITVVMARRDDLKLRTVGGIRWDKGKKSATLWVLDASEYRVPVREMLDDMELTIVHELVHLELSSLPRSQASRGSEEHAVNQIAGAMLKLDRRK